MGFSVKTKGNHGVDGVLRHSEVIFRGFFPERITGRVPEAPGKLVVLPGKYLINQLVVILTD
ncbi:hypothetical protein [Denitratisoma sp. DHT3]|uniref:hypothetical protein n=1 Tax=Denitratisoma sp. DHT3 TaxID=1981880 RepID=UPI0011A9FCF7|nr:hypothetical protein [Denitratisoma sp. DHT3]